MLAFRSGVRGSRRKYEVNHKKAKDKMKFKIIRHSCPPLLIHQTVLDSLFTTFILKFILSFAFLCFTSYFLFLTGTGTGCTHTRSHAPTMLQHITKFKFCCASQFGLGLSEVSSRWRRCRRRFSCDGRLSSGCLKFSYFSMKINDEFKVNSSLFLCNLFAMWFIL